MVDFPGKPKYGPDDLRQVVEILRGENGCPWDRVQTHETLRRNLLEECDELCEAIDRADTELMKEELGDVWLQVIFHASIEQEKGTFDLDDVADAECRKLISRHPHVFGDASFGSLGEELAAWEQLKPAYDHYKPDAEGNVPADTWINFSELNSVPYRMSCDTVEFSYEFFPDMRVSPMDAADEIHDRIPFIRSRRDVQKN